jgi:hypothetical protein
MSEQFTSSPSPLPYASPSPSPSPAPQGPPVSRAEEHGHYSEVVGSPGDADVGDAALGPQQGGPDSRPHLGDGQTRFHTTEPSPLAIALPPRTYADTPTLPPEYEGKVQFDRNELRKARELFDAARGEQYEANFNELALMHARGIEKVRAEMQQQQRDVWNRMSENWINQVKSDPDSEAAG